MAPSSPGPCSGHGSFGLPFGRPSRAAVFGEDRALRIPPRFESSQEPVGGSSRRVPRQPIGSLSPATDSLHSGGSRQWRERTPRGFRGPVARHATVPPCTADGRPPRSSPPARCRGREALGIRRLTISLGLALDKPLGVPFQPFTADTTYDLAFTEPSSQASAAPGQGRLCATSWPRALPVSGSRRRHRPHPSPRADPPRPGARPHPERPGARRGSAARGRSPPPGAAPRTGGCRPAA